MNKNKSVSEIVEDYFREIAKHNRRRKNIVDLVDKLDKPSIDAGIDLKDEYYKKQAGKYGF